jgi:hypothetical protein
MFKAVTRTTIPASTELSLIIHLPSTYLATHLPNLATHLPIYPSP